MKGPAVEIQAQILVQHPTVPIDVYPRHPHQQKAPLRVKRPRQWQPLGMALRGLIRSTHTLRLAAAEGVLNIGSGKTR